MSAITDLAHDERTARMLLSILAEPDDPVTGRVLARVGAVETLRLVEDEDAVPGLNRVDAAMWRDRLALPHRLENIAERMHGIEQSGFTVLIPGDEHWPKALADLGDRTPYVLWARRATSFLARPMEDFVTITGARASTAYGGHMAAELAADLAGAERVVVAGGAYGIEGAAHRSTLAAGGDTIAVLAGGVDRPYPAGHRELLDRVSDVGLLASEMPPGATPTRHRFLARGRLLAALSDASVIVEAGVRSGSLRVAAEARTLGRGVGAVPGPVTSLTSAGPHMMLRDGTARVVTNPTDVEHLTRRPPEHGIERSELGPEFSRQPRPNATGQTRSM